MVWISGMLLIVLIYSLFIPSIPTVKDVKDFKVTQSQTLYFKNIRAYFYEKEDIETSGMAVYRFKKLLGESDLEYYPIIVHNWRHDELFLLFEARSTQKPTADLVITSNQQVFQLDEVSVSKHVKLALELLPELYEDTPLAFNQKVLSEKDKALVKMVINDYLKWLK